MTIMELQLKQSPEPWKPHLFQKTSVKFLLQHGAAGLFLDPGLGKTSIVLAALKLLFKEKTEDKVLIVAPLRVCMATWPGEVEKWIDFRHLRVVVLHGPNKDELLAQEADIYLINPEGLDWLLQTVKTKNPRTNKTTVTCDVRAFKKHGFGTLVIDELTKFKNHSSDRFKAMKLVLPTFRRRWGLTGSPAANGLEQLFGQMYMLDEGRSLGQYITHYRRKYFVPHPNGFDWVLQAGAEDDIYERISPLVLRLGIDLIDMPTLIPNPIYVDLPPKARKAYDAIEDDLFAAIDGGQVVAKNTGVALGKCRQVAGGAIFLTPEVVALIKTPPKNREVAHIHDEKVEALQDLVEELQGTPLLVAYEFHHERDRLKKAFPKAVFVADYKPAQFKSLEAKWNRGEIDLMFSNAGPLAHGLNLQQRGNHICWFTPIWDFEVYDQFIRRVWRQGNKAQKVFVHTIIARGTVDEMVVAALRHKDKTQSAMFEALQKMAKSRKKRAR